jgi:hypothetical protein
MVFENAQLFCGCNNYSNDRACKLLPGNVNYPVAIIIVAIMVAYVGLVYGPIGAFLAEYFPGRIRYTSVSVPYHIGNG